MRRTQKWLTFLSFAMAAALSTAAQGATPVCTAVVAAPASVEAGDPLVLTATCNNGPTQYEWSRNGTVLATGASASFSTIAPSSAGSYTYAVRAKNDPTWSNVVSVVVAVADDNDDFVVNMIAALIPQCQTPVVAPLQAGQSLYTGQSATVSVTCTQTPANYVWSLNGTVLAGATTASITTTIPTGISSATFSVIANGRLPSRVVATSAIPVFTQQTITFGAQTSPRTFVANGTFAISPLATASSGLPVAYTSTTPAICTVSGTTVTMVVAGTCTIAANQAGNATYVAAPQVTQTIALSNAATGNVLFAGQPAAATVGSSIGLNANFVGSSPATAVTYTNLANGAAIGTNCTPGVPCSWSPGAVGVYNVRASVTLQNGEVKTSTSTFVVAASPAITTSNAPIPVPTAAVGTSPGSFSVSESGAATYSLPIQVPPGTAGMQPNLSLNYSSQGGNGHLGVGWSLGGLSSVTRCPTTYAQDGDKQGINYDNSDLNDSYCLDGQRLIPIGETTVSRFIWDCGLEVTSKETRPVKAITYRTENDSYSHIVSYSESPNCLIGPSRFEAHTKDGRIVNYGSRYWVGTRGIVQNVQHASRVNVAFMWVMDQVEDRLGNRMLIDYQGNKVWVANSPGNTNGAPCTRALLAAMQCTEIDTTIFLGQRAPSTGALNRVTGVGALPGVEVWPTQIVYTLNSTTNNSTAQVVQFAYQERTDFPGGTPDPGFVNQCGDCGLTFDAGSGQHLLTKYLKKVETKYDGSYDKLTAIYSGGTTVRQYDLRYSNSPATRRLRLDGVTEKASDGVALPETVFTWQGSSLTVTKTLSGPNTTIGFGDGNGTDPRVIDYDGDGRSDLVRLTGNDSEVRLRLALSSQGWAAFDTKLLNIRFSDIRDFWDVGDFNGDGKVDVAIADQVVTGGHTWSIFLSNQSGGFTQVTHTASGSRMQSPGNNKPSFRGDFNGDGTIDLAFLEGESGQKNRWRVYFGSANNTMIGPVYLEHPNYIGGTDAETLERVTIGDFTGDGRADFGYRPNRAVGFELILPYHWRVCSTSTVPAKPVANTTYQLDCTELIEATPGPVQRNTIVDMNGDGLADLIAPEFENGGPQCQFGNATGVSNRPMTRCWRMCLATGDGAFSCSVLAGPATATDGGVNWDEAKQTALKQTVFGDFNGDGRTDYAAPLSATEWTVCLSRGASISSSTVYGTEASEVPRFDCSIATASSVLGSTWPHSASTVGNVLGSTIYVGDFMGTGRTSILSRPTDTTIHLMTPDGDMPDLVSGIKTGLEATTSITYKPLTDSTVYSKGAGNWSYPNFLIQSPLYVVSQTVASTVGDTFNTSYRYEGLVGAVDTIVASPPANVGVPASTGAGRGMLGFAKRTITDGNDIITEIESSQVWPAAGRPTKITKFAPSGNVNRKVNEVVNTWETTERVRPFANLNRKTYETFLTSTVEKSWELNGHDGADATLLHIVTTSTALNQYDAYGNPLSISVSTSDGYTKTTTNTYSNDADNWVLGRLKTSSVTSTRPDNTSPITRNAAFDYYCIDNFACPDTRQRGLLAAEHVEKSATPTDTSLSTTYTYDAYGNKASATVTYYELNSSGSLVQKTRGSQTIWINEGRFPGTQTNAAGHQEFRTFEGRWGSPKSVKSPDGLRAEYTYDGFGRKVGEQAYDSHEGGLLLAQSAWTYATASSGNEKYSIEARKHDGTVATAYFDNLQREVRASTNTFGGTTVESSTKYDKLGRKIWSKRPVAGTAGNTSTSATYVDYDVLNRPVTETVLKPGTDPDSWISGGRPAASVFTTTTSAYTRVASADPAYGATVRTRSNVSVTRTNSATNGGNQVTSRETNSQGHTVRVVDANSKETWYKYDAVGNLERVTAPLSTVNNVATTYVENMTYDQRGRKISMSNLDSGSWTYGYNGAGELTRQVDANGSVTQTTYDNLGRISSRVENAGNSGVVGFITTWFYDNALECGTAQPSRVGKLCRVMAIASGSGSGSTKTITYDSQARPFQVLTRINNTEYRSYTTYDANGRPDLTGYPANESGANLWIKNEYTANGFLEKVRDADSNGVGTVHWQALSRYNDGQPYEVKVGGVTVTKGYDDVGRIASIVAAGLQNSSYTFDQIGNLVTRTDSYSVPSETYTYDKLNRLATGPAGSYTYDDGGNLTAKPGAGTLSYLANSHRLNLAGYTYDNNGNLTAKPATGGTVAISQYTPFNLPVSISKNGTTVLAYDYDGDRARIKETSTQGTDVVNTIYVGNQFFEEITKNGAKEYRYYIGSPDGVIAVASVSNAATGNTRTDKYWLKDHLGSLYGEFTGTNITRIGFDAWGTSNNLQFGGLATQRGFTGHEHLTEVGLIHMNGRLYDPLTGRMMQADPIIQDPFNPQNFNRYSYVMNNPLSFTDPTGFSWWTKWRRPIFSIAVGWALGPAGFWGNWVGGSSLLTTAAAGFASGGISGGNLNSALQGAFFAAAFFQVGEWSGAHAATAANPMTGMQRLGQVAGHAAVGCAQSAAAGGSCKAGAMSAGFAAAAGPHLPGKEISVERFLSRIVVGAIGSKLGGGSYENGAMTAAFGYLFNDLGSLKDRGYVSNSTKERFETIKRWAALANDPQLSNAIESATIIETDKQSTTMGRDAFASLISPKTILVYPAFNTLSLPDKLGALAHEVGHMTDENMAMFERMSSADAFLRTSKLLAAETNANVWAMKILQAGRPGTQMPESIKWADK